MQKHQTTIKVTELDRVWEGDWKPLHSTGVTQMLLWLDKFLFCVVDHRDHDSVLVPSSKARSPVRSVLYTS